MCEDVTEIWDPFQNKFILYGLYIISTKRLRLIFEMGITLMLRLIFISLPHTELNEYNTIIKQMICLCYGMAYTA